jgi:hypothetical protein
MHKLIFKINNNTKKINNMRTTGKSVFSIVRFDEPVSIGYTSVTKEGINSIKAELSYPLVKNHKEKLGS